jgi:hypothetical protein
MVGGMGAGDGPRERLIESDHYSDDLVRAYEIMNLNMSYRCLYVRMYDHVWKRFACS